MRFSEETETRLWTGALALACIAILTLSGCATKPPAPTAEETIKAGVIDGAIAAAKAPLFKMTCSPTCTFASLEVGNPAGASQMAEVVKIAMTPAPDESSQNYRATLQTIGQLGVWGIGAHAVSNIFGSITSGFTTMGKQIQAPGAITTTTNTTNTTNTLSGTGVLGSGTYTAPITTTTTTTINPTPEVCAPNAAGLLVCN